MVIVRSVLGLLNGEFIVVDYLYVGVGVRMKERKKRG